MHSTRVVQTYPCNRGPSQNIRFGEAPYAILYAPKLHKGVSGSGYCLQRESFDPDLLDPDVMDVMGFMAPVESEQQLQSGRPSTNGATSGLRVPREGLPFDPQQHALNVLDGQRYPHHPVMREARMRVYPIHRELITEWNGLLVPAAYDCDIFLRANRDANATADNRSNAAGGGHGTTSGGAKSTSRMKHWGSYGYFFEVPTRWHTCQQHRAALESGLLYTVPMLPMVDDEYAEHVAVWHAVLRARHLAKRRKPGRAFIFGELGARWGTWAGRAGAFARSLGVSFELLMVEASRVHCKGIRTVMALNAWMDMEGQSRLDCEPANVARVRSWLLEKDHVDALDIDIQGAELPLVTGLIDAFDAKVARLIIGTHNNYYVPPWWAAEHPDTNFSRSNQRIHDVLRALLVAHGWRIVWDVPLNQKTDCVAKYLRGSYRTPNEPQRFDWAAMLKIKGCTRPTPRGPVANWDGELIADNPRLVDVAKGFSMHDEVLKEDDLL